MIHVTSHAIQRAMERVPGISTEEEAKQALRSPAVATAIRFGAHYVRLGTGQHVVIRDEAIITVLPKDAPLWRLNYFARGNA